MSTPTPEQLTDAAERATPHDESHDGIALLASIVRPRPVGPFAPSPLHSPGYGRGYAAYMNGDCEPPDETFVEDWNAGMDAALLNHEGPGPGIDRRVGIASALGFVAGALTVIALWCLS